MKQCTYCSKEYPDEATACAVDQEPLVSVQPASSSSAQNAMYRQATAMTPSPGHCSYNLLVCLLCGVRGGGGFLAGLLILRAVLGILGVEGIDARLSFRMILNIALTLGIPAGFFGYAFSLMKEERTLRFDGNSFFADFDLISSAFKRRGIRGVRHLVYSGVLVLTLEVIIFAAAGTPVPIGKGEDLFVCLFVMGCILTLAFMSGKWFS